ncbi:MAG: T9SS type A sorting domain-containing protein [Bacteroidota bacterium]
MSKIKRKISLLSGLILVASASAQNAYHIAEIKANAAGKNGVNPRFLNVERDDQSEGDGWRMLPWDSSTNGYSSIDSVPFAFQFNGSAARKFRATKNGVLTFGGSTASAANFVVESLPDPRIPNSSIVVGGIIATGPNDRILVKTFGAAPNRQFWVKFQSFSLGKDTANKYGTYVYNAIVLEEKSQAIHIVRMGWGSEYPWYATNLPLKNEQANGLQVGPFESYPLAGVSALLNDVPAQGKSFQDNSYVSFYPGKQKDNDASLSKGYSTKPAGTSYVNSGNNVPLEISAVFTLHGTNQNTNYNLQVQVNNEPVVSTPLSFVNFTDYRSAVINHTILRNMQPGDRAKVKAWLSVNGGGSDDNVTNDTLPLVFDFVAQQGSGSSAGKVLVESYTATWCNQCPAVNVALDSLESKFGNGANFVSHHINDNMNNKWAPLSVDSLPLVVLNRETRITKASDLNAAVTAAVASAPKGVSLSWGNLEFNQAKRQVTGVLQLTAQDAWVKQGLRFGVMLREQGVRGLGAGWDQKVDFGLTKDSQSVFFGKNKTLVGYHHQRVIWAVFGGKSGVNATAGADVLKSGDKLDIPFTLTIPDTMLTVGMPTAADFGPTGSIYSRFKPADLSVVGYVSSDFGAGITETVNLGEYSAPVLASIAQPLWDIKNGVVRPDAKQVLNLYPNPASGWVSLGIEGKINEVSVFDVSGRSVSGLSLKDNRLDLQGLMPGLYFVRVKTQLGIGTARLLVD